MDQRKNLAEQKIPALLAKFAVPSILSLVARAFYHIIDRIFIGRALGAPGLAGITLGFPAILLVFGLCILFSSGSASLISIYLGENKREKAEKILGTTIVLISITGLLLSFFGNLYHDKFFLIFNASREVLPHAKDYLRIILAGSPFFLFGFTLTFAIRASGDPFFATIAIVAGTILNIILDPVFIFIFALGTAGAALATIIAEAVVALMCMIYLLKKKGIVHIRLKNLRLNGVLIRSITYIGLSPALMKIATSIQTVFINKRLLTFGGDTAVAAVGIILPILSMINLFTYGMASGMQPIVGFNHGAGQSERTKKTFYYACSINFLFILAFLGLILFYAENIAGLFIIKNEKLLSTSSEAMRIFLLMSPFAVINILGTRYFQAVGKASTSIFIGLLRQMIIFLPLLYLLPLRYALAGVWYSAPLSDFLAALITLVFLRFEMKSPSNGFFDFGKNRTF